MRKRTKIVCTIGPASKETDILIQMIQAGMNVARLNFSHGTYDDHAQLIANIRAAAAQCKEPVGILADLQGPRLRMGDMPDPGVEVKDHEAIVFDASATVYKGKRKPLPLVFPELPRWIKKGDRILIDDGQIEATVERVQGTLIHCKVAHGGVIKSHKGINTPDTHLKIASLTAKDKKDVAFLARQGVDWFGFSFVQTARDVKELRALIARYTSKKDAAHTHLRILAKIETHQAVRNIEEIIRAADGVMVARGDLGLELPAEEVPLLQKRIIQMCVKAAKPVIVATQMLDSMIRSPRPTRAEVSDVANAVIDHTDAVMLSGETAGGAYPLQAVKMMARICKRTERSHFDDVSLASLIVSGNPDSMLTKLARILAEKSKVKALVASSLSGATGRQLSSFRSEVSVYVATNNERVCRQLNLSWGVHPFVVKKCETPEELARRSLEYLKAQKIVKKGNRIVLLAGSSVGKSGGINMMELKKVG
ncbi:MAG: pyruvate kinase [Candidatus Magasanikbacteria bacterium]|nr:pyruvate kinase [Candidatus Magasanikbacteria bacterium]